MPSFFCSFRENENKNGANIGHNMKVKDIFLLYF